MYTPPISGVGKTANCSSHVSGTRGPHQRHGCCTTLRVHRFRAFCTGLPSDVWRGTLANYCQCKTPWPGIHEFKSLKKTLMSALLCLIATGDIFTEKSLCRLRKALICFPQTMCERKANLPNGPRPIPGRLSLGYVLIVSNTLSRRQRRQSPLSKMKYPKEHLVLRLPVE